MKCLNKVNFNENNGVYLCMFYETFAFLLKQNFDTTWNNNMQNA